MFGRMIGEALISSKAYSIPSILCNIQIFKYLDKGIDSLPQTQIF